MAPQARQAGDGWRVIVPVHLQATSTEFHSKTTGGQHIERQHAVIGMATKARDNRNTRRFYAILALTHFIHLINFNHKVHTASRVGVLI
ncbi:MAG: hypothetical protein ACSHWQ_03455, partial [Spongiibacteraceae bacterium]